MIDVVIFVINDVSFVDTNIKVIALSIFVIIITSTIKERERRESKPLVAAKNFYFCIGVSYLTQ